MADATQDLFCWKLHRNPHAGAKRKLTAYEAVLKRNSKEIQRLYWNGSLQETVNLVRTIALKCEADRFRIIEFTDSRPEVDANDAAPDFVRGVTRAPRRLIALSHVRGTSDC